MTHQTAIRWKLRRHLSAIPLVCAATLAASNASSASMWNGNFADMRACMQPAADYDHLVQALEADGWQVLHPPLPPKAVHMLAVENFVTFNITLLPQADEADPDFWQQVWNDAHDFAQGSQVSMIGPIGVGDGETAAHVVFSKTDSLLRVLATFLPGKSGILCYLIVPSHQIAAFEGVTSVDWLEAFEGSPAAIQMPVDESDLYAIARHGDASEFVALSYLANSNRVADLTQGAFKKGDEHGFLILVTNLNSQPKAVTP